MCSTYILWIHDHAKVCCYNSTELSKGTDNKVDCQLCIYICYYAESNWSTLSVHNTPGTLYSNNNNNNVYSTGTNSSKYFTSTTLVPKGAIRRRAKGRECQARLNANSEKVRGGDRRGKSRVYL